ncbi:serine carboxypeptidase-domain-containing protein [Blyttiomyces helicus]|uniref:Serine carboxypeptidase-domain-containing protein n=1 Tax=Blyttiomyces helicus TaxID=388810 RepID=A0A4V1IPY0_9FUNG|nr:serine carboxypeptidase-domain-containing protein [Blyttiomyces helicus]|eukprot:RKO84627.1 serine carboxypeptidase-domain-containing protein [Blyttiomyces helicus]
MLLTADVFTVEGGLLQELEELCDERIEDSRSWLSTPGANENASDRCLPRKSASVVERKTGHVLRITDVRFAMMAPRGQPPESSNHSECAAQGPLELRARDVQPVTDGLIGRMYSGTLPILKDGAYLFFWYIKSSTPSKDLVVWLNGGPGCSSMIGAFEENGPLRVSNSSTGPEWSRNPYSWDNAANILYGSLEGRWEGVHGGLRICCIRGLFGEDDGNHFTATPDFYIPGSQN